MAVGAEAEAGAGASGGGGCTVAAGIDANAGMQPSGRADRDEDDELLLSFKSTDLQWKALSRPASCTRAPGMHIDVYYACELHFEVTRRRRDVYLAPRSTRCPEPSDVADAVSLCKLRLPPPALPYLEAN